MRGVRFHGSILAVAIALGGIGAEPSAAEESTWRVANFEGELTSDEFSPRDTLALVVDDEVRGKGRVLRWTQAKSEDGGWLEFRHVPKDVRPYRMFRFRVRAVGTYGDDVTVRIRSKDGALAFDVTRVASEWRTVEVPLPEMRIYREFDPEGVWTVRFICWETKGFTLELDDIEFIEGEGGWRYTKADRESLGIDTSGPRFRIGDFEHERCLDHVHARSCRCERVPAKPRRKGYCLRWTVDPTDETAWLSLTNIPEDIREYRFLRFRARAPKHLCDDVTLRLRSDDGSIGGSLPTLGKRWSEYEIRLPEMRETNEFDPEKVYALRMVCWGTKGFTLDMDDIELVKGPGGWRMSKQEHLVYVFGEARVKKVKEIETKHFRIFTDSSAARRKFPRALEKTYDFVRKALDLGEMPGLLDVFIFQNPKLYCDFCVRRGWSREAAEATAGHAWSEYLATYYQAPGAATVTHELTHSICHRILGVGGGSWLQEGAAVCVEARWQKRDAATLYAPLLRSGRHFPLAEFFRVDKLIHGEDIRGGAGTSGSLYLQAGAFFEFLLRGPFHETRPEAIRRLAELEWDEETIVGDVEQILGTSTDEIESAWIEWGSDPPKIQ